MRRVLFFAVACVMTIAPTARVSAQAAANGHTVVAVAPEQVQWFTPTYYTDGRQRAQLFGDSRQGGVWVDRVKMPGDIHVRAHTHPSDELVTVIQGTWYVGMGTHFDSTKLKGYPAGTFVMIPAGVPHFVATKKGPVIVQLNGTAKFGTDYVEK